ncbi:MAG: peptide chain release factor N(5)-glutamine methyltransferase [Candidatus Nomurabacteria bacterium]|jgi:release factor glutamine methyltransferase|nr:peptide chain release factor N(5)-glutamine methyltransferase [Candidatus Nomurabacteria bacterium]
MPKITKPKMPTFATWLKSSTQILKAVSASPHLDAQIILGFVTHQPYEKLLIRDQTSLKFSQLLRATYYLHLRTRLVPIAYITHRKKFHGHTFYVNKHVLIPRPETENLVALASKHAKTLPKNPNILDVGCGSGCIGLSLYYSTLNAKSQEQNIKSPSLLLSDISEKALKVAHKNAKKLKIKADFRKSNLLNRINIENIDIITANLPYVNKNWNWNSKSLKHEPPLALFARKNGLEIIEKLLTQISQKPRKTHLAIFLEADPSQMPAIKSFTHNLFPSAKITIDNFVAQIIL